ncbi:unnamed protein product, partial [marine sediment metagenome]
QVSVDGLTGSFSAVGAPPPPTAKLYGKVSDTLTGQPLPNVRVTLYLPLVYPHAIEKWTDSLGQYLFDEDLITPGSYTVTFWKSMYKEVTKGIALIEGPNELNVQMMPIAAPGVVLLTVLAPQDVGYKFYHTYYKVDYWDFSLGFNRWFIGNPSRFSFKSGGGGRFQNVPIPQGAHIKTARLRLFSATDTTATVVRSRIRGVAADSTSPFSTLEDYDRKLANSLAAIVTWDNVPARGYFGKLISPELRSIIQELV